MPLLYEEFVIFDKIISETETRARIIFVLHLLHVVLMHNEETINRYC